MSRAKKIRMPRWSLIWICKNCCSGGITHVFGMETLEEAYKMVESEHHNASPKCRKYEQAVPSVFELYNENYN
jgi:hypothetical protein